ncbi:SDR family NAD(P)-dependent oxidoreductase [Croceibacterium sp. TMG7-5b_MA50]|uniref:SDR family NAD(P)-dependent oxidoreductase n=1 Tax=Croceibacterium sp. TMG7-5b_MA50 TaxID=3121290 RepID=UPI0032220CBE
MGEPARTAMIFGAGGGIGAALVRRLAESGGFAAIHAGARTAPAHLPGSVVPFRFDLEDEGSIAAAVAALAGPPDLVFVATGVLHDTAASIAPEKSYRQVRGDTLAHLFQVNAIGPAIIARHTLPLLPRDRRAVFAVLSARVGSIADNRLGGWHSYRASKAALNMLVRSFAIEQARTHPQAIVAALHPGTVDTGLSAPFQRGVPAGKLFSPDQSAGYLLDVLDGLTPADSGGLFAWDGTRIAY